MVGAMTRPSFVRGVVLLSAALLLFGCKKSDGALPASGTIGAFSLTDQAGKPFTQEDLKGKVWVGAFMFTRCPTVCPRMMRIMKKLQDRAKSEGVPLHFVSFSVDPENDTPPVLLKFAQKYAVDLASWSFLTGNYDEVKRTSVESFKMALEGSANADASDFGILHGSHLVLVDKNLRIRGFYPTKNEDNLQKLLVDAESLVH
jgi:protein SCO1/2